MSEAVQLLGGVVSQGGQHGTLISWGSRRRWRKWAIIRYRAWQKAVRKARWAARMARLAASGTVTMAMVVDLLTRSHLQRHLGALTAGLLAASIFMIARYLYRKQSSPSKWFGILILLMGCVLAVILGMQVAEWVSVSLSAWWPQEEWLFLDSFLVGLLGGMAYGNYKTLSRRKSIALASLTTFLLALTPFFLIAMMSLFGVPLPL